jgi:O-antigen/teichoic acid export membrane protein
MTRTSYRQSLLIAWWLLRQVLGWSFILLGLIGLVLPVLQGVLFLVIGIALVGRRNWLIRRSTLVFKRCLRRWAAVRIPLVGGAGRIALRAQWKCSRESRHLHRRYAEWRQRRVCPAIEMEEITE